MQIVVASQDRKQCESLRAMLSGLGHTVTVAHTLGDISRVLMAGGSTDVGIVCEPVAEWVDPFREHSTHLIYVIGVLDRMSGRSVREAWETGVDDLMAARAPDEEVAGRVDALQRIRAWVGSMGDDFALGESDPLQDLAVFVELAQLLGAEFGEMVGSEMEGDALTCIPNLEYAAEIPMALVSDDLEVTVGVGLRKDAVEAFSGRIFGESVGNDVMADAMREFANSAGGAVKRSANGEGRVFSLGLPVDAMLVKPPQDSRAWKLKTGDLELCIWLNVRQDKPQRLSASMLKEGMVISKPVKNGAGVMLVPQGTVLTERTVARLLQLLGPSTLVEVSNAA